MADSDVVISAFLELKDRMSAGIRSAASELDMMLNSVKRVTTTTDAMASHHGRASASIYAGLDSLSHGFSSVTTAAETATGAVSDMGDETEASGDSMIAAVAKGTALVEILKGIGTAAISAAKEFTSASMELNRTFENTALRIAGTLVAYDMSPNIQAAQAESARLLGTLQEIAAVKPGETADYIDVFTQVLPKAIEAGMQDMQKIAEFTSLYTAVAVNSVDAAQAGRDLYMILAGQAGSEQRMWQVLGTQIGVAAAEFNKLTAPERLGLVTKVLEKQSSAVEAASATYDAVYGEYQSLVKEITMISGQEAFTEMKDVYAAINAYLKENKQDLIVLGKLIMDGMVGGAKILAGWFVIIEKTVSGLVSLIGWVADKLASVRKLVMSLFYDVSHLVEKTDEATAAQRNLNAAKEDGYKTDMQYRRQLAEAAKEYEKDLANAQKREGERQAIRSELWFPDLEKKMGLEGKEIMGRLAPHVRKLAEITKAGGYGKEEALKFLEAKGADRAIAEEMWRSIEAQKKEATEHKVKARKHRATTPKVVQDFRYSKFNITQEFAEGFDPDRIAVAFASDLGRLGEMKTQAVYSPTFAI